MEQIQSQLKVEDGAVAPCWQVAAELAEEQRIRSRACWRGDISGNLAAAADPVMDVITQVSSQITAVWQDIQRNARERKKGGDFLQKRRGRQLTAQALQYSRNWRFRVFDAFAEDK